MKLIIDITEHEWKYLNKLVANDDILGHYERLLVSGHPLEQEYREDCVSRQAAIDAVGNTITKYIPTFIGPYERIPLELVRAINDVPPVTPTKCIANIQFSKEDLKKICEERIEIDMKRGTCKDCKHWKDSDGVYRRGIGTENKCPVNNSRVFEGTFYCADFEKRGE